MSVKQLTPQETRQVAEQFLQGRCPLVLATTGDDGSPVERCRYGKIEDGTVVVGTF